MITYAHFWLGMEADSKTGGVTPCQFDSDLWPQKSRQGKPLEGIKT